jgi:hypothetical protein
LKKSWKKKALMWYCCVHGSVYMGNDNADSVDSIFVYEMFRNCHLKARVRYVMFPENHQLKPGILKIIPKAAFLSFKELREKITHACRYTVETYSCKFSQ